MGAGDDDTVGHDGPGERPVDAGEAEGGHRPTYCANCKHVYRVNKSDHPKYWLCSAAKREPDPWFVCEGVLRHPPYQYCTYVNQRGNCPEYDEAPKEQQITFKQKET